MSKCKALRLRAKEHTEVCDWARISKVTWLLSEVEVHSWALMRHRLFIKQNPYYACFGYFFIFLFWHKKQMFQFSSSFFCLDTKKWSKKNQDCARFARKISAQTAKSSKLATSLLKQGRFLTLLSLIFRLIGQGRSLNTETLRGCFKSKYSSKNRKVS